MVLHPVSPAPQPPTVMPPPPAPTTTITVQLQHQCVTLGYMSGGVSWWDGAFLGETGWYIPGMTRGASLPRPPSEAGSSDLAYGLPVALIVVQGLTVSGSWTNETPAALGSLGPFSLQGATTTSGNNGSVTYSRPGMQVIALLCSQLPILPPVDDPGPAQPTATATAPTTATSTVTAPPAVTPATTGSTSSPSGSAAPAPAATAATAAAPAQSAATSAGALTVSTPKTTT